nr:hypothetical protein [Tanacetum cinerariifolium]
IQALEGRSLAVEVRNMAFFNKGEEERMLNRLLLDRGVERRTPYVFLHTPDNIQAPDLARRFHRQLMTLLPGLPELPELDRRRRNVKQQFSLQLSARGGLRVVRRSRTATGGAGGVRGEGRTDRSSGQLRLSQRL